MDPLVVEFSVACSADHAFAVWADRTSMWWPHDHSVSGDPELTVTFEPRPGGRIFERTSQGTEHDWGEVLVWEPPAKLVYLWHIGRDRGAATEVEVNLSEEGPDTTISIVHRDGNVWETRDRTSGTGIARVGRVSFPITRERVPRRRTGDGLVTWW